MIEPAYYYLSEVEELFRLSRDSLTRWAKAGIFVLTGENKGRRVTGASVRAAYARQEAGEDLWLAVKQYESSAPSEPKPTVRAQSTRTNEARGGTRPQPKTESDSSQFEPLVNRGHDKLRRII